MKDVNGIYYILLPELFRCPFCGCDVYHAETAIFSVKHPSGPCILSDQKWLFSKKEDMLSSWNMRVKG